MPSSQELNAGLKTILALSEAIREAGEIPSGTLYAAVMQVVDIHSYQKILDMLKGAGLIEEDRSHLLRWIGPMKEARG